MKCDQVRLELSLLLPGEAGPPGCGDHLRLCPDCSTFAANIQKQNQEMVSLVRPTPTDWAWLVKQQPQTSKVVTTPAPLHPMARKERTFGKIAVTVALAASLLVATIGLLPWLPFPILGGNGQRVAVGGNTSRSVSPDAPAAKSKVNGGAVEPAAKMEASLPIQENKRNEVLKEETLLAKDSKLENLSRAELAPGSENGAGNLTKDSKKPMGPPLPAPAMAPATDSTQAVANNQKNASEKKDKALERFLATGAAENNIALAYNQPGAQQNYFFTDPNTSRNILRNTVTPQQKVQFALNLCQYTSDEALSWVKVRSDQSSGQNSLEMLKSNALNSNRAGGQMSEGAQPSQTENPTTSNPAPSQSREFTNPFRGMDPDQKMAKRTPEALVKEYEEFIEKDIPSLLEGLRSPSNKKDLEPLVQQLTENATKWTKLAKDNPQQAIWITKMIDLSRKGIAKIEARYR